MPGKMCPNCYKVQVNFVAIRIGLVLQWIQIPKWATRKTAKQPHARATERINFWFYGGARQTACQASGKCEFLVRFPFKREQTHRLHFGAFIIAFRRWSVSDPLDQCKQNNNLIHCNSTFSVEECKKRWRSLRDAFMKQYKLFQRGDTSIKKRWLFYEQMEFLAPYFDA